MLPCVLYVLLHYSYLTSVIALLKSRIYMQNMRSLIKYDTLLNYV